MRTLSWDSRENSPMLSSRSPVEGMPMTEHSDTVRDARGEVWARQRRCSPVPGAVYPDRRDHRAVPPLPAGDLRRGDRSGARNRAARPGAACGPGLARLPVLRPARLRQDDIGPDPGALPELRAGPDAGPVRRVRLLPRAGPRWLGQP